MAVDSVFDRLALEISPEERSRMLEKISGSFEYSEEPFVSVVEGDEGQTDLLQVYNTLGFFRKIILFLKRVFLQIELLTLVEDLVLNRLAREVDRRVPGLMDIRAKTLRGVLRADLQALLSRLAFFQEPLAEALRTRRVGFVAFHGSRFLSSAHLRLQDGTDVAKLGEANPELDLKELRTRLEATLDAIIDEIGENERRTMLYTLRSLELLQEISAFPIAALASQFRSFGDTDEGSAAFEDLRVPLEELAATLLAPGMPPPHEAIESVLLFVNNGVFADKPNELDAVFARYKPLVADAFQALREFTLKYPLLSLLRCVTGKSQYMPKKQGGGEDWPKLYRQYWKQRIQEGYQSYASKRERAQVMNEALAFLGTDHLPNDHFYRAGLFGIDSVLHGTSIAYLSAFFHEVVVRKLNAVLKRVLIDGEFYKKDNSTEYTDAYNNLMRLPERLAALNERISHRGDIGKALEGLKDEAVTESQRKSRVEKIVLLADQEASSIVDFAKQAQLVLINVLKGILYGEVGGRYDTLSNLSYIGGKNNQMFLADLDAALKALEHALRIMEGLVDIETRTHSVAQGRSGN